jgi:hypothetical protein
MTLNLKLETLLSRDETGTRIVEARHNTSSRSRLHWQLMSGTVGVTGRGGGPSGRGRRGPRAAAGASARDS